MLDAPTVLRGHLADRAALFCCLQAVCSELPMEEIQNLYRDLLPLYLGLPDQLEEASMIKDKYYLLGDAPDGLKKKTDHFGTDSGGCGETGRSQHFSTLWPIMLWSLDRLSS